MAFLATLGREILKGIRDLEGDRKAGIKTLAITKGLKYSAKASSLAIISAVILSLATILVINNKLAYAAFIIPADTVFMYSSFRIIKHPDSYEADRQRRMTLIGMLLGILGFTLSS